MAKHILQKNQNKQIHYLIITLIVDGISQPKMNIIFLVTLNLLGVTKF